MRHQFLLPLLAIGYTLVAPPAYAAPVADHTVISQFGNITQAQMQRAANYRILYMHQSTGGDIDFSGLNCLAGLRDGWDGYPAECTIYANHVNSFPWYDRSKWSWDYWPESQADAIAKTDQFVSLVPGRQANYDVIGMKYCYVDGWNQSDNIAYNNNEGYYLHYMKQLEAQYPNKIFIYATSVLWNNPGK